MSFVGKISSVFGVVGLSTLATLGVVESASAAWIDFDVDAKVQTKVFGKVGQTTGTFETEMQVLDLEITEFNAMLRESPTLSSTGETTITEIGEGEFKIDSFFDLNLELSVDGGNTWIAAMNSTRVELASSPDSETTGVIVDSPVLPPIDGGYLTPDEVHALFKIPGRKPIKFDNIFHRVFVNIDRIEMGNDEVEMFDSKVMGKAHDVPEPLTILGSATALGFGALLKKQSSRKRNKKDVS